MYCSKCGRKLTNETYCPDCGEKNPGISQVNDKQDTVAEVIEVAEKSGSPYTEILRSCLIPMNASKTAYLSLLGLLVVELVLAFMPTVEVTSKLLDQTWAFGFLDIQGDNNPIWPIIALHIAAILVVAVPPIANRKLRGIHFFPAALAAMIISFMYFSITLNLDSLVSEFSDTLLGMFASFASLDISLTMASNCLIIVSGAAFLLAIGLLLNAGNDELAA